jgi:hypothetical protein
MVEPAARLGVHFEDDARVAEMVRAVEKERGALPRDGWSDESHASARWKALADCRTRGPRPVTL